MTDYNAIPDASINPDSAITTQLKTRERDNLLAIAEQSSGAPTLPFTRIYYCEEQVASGSDSNTALPAIAAWTPRRDLVAVVDTLEADGTAGADAISGANDDTINLPLGTYWMRGTAWAYQDSGGPLISLDRLRLRNTTDNSTELLGTSSGRIVIADDSSAMIEIGGYFQITGSKALQLQHYHSSGNADSGGYRTSLGTEVYATATFWRLNLTGT